MVTEVPEMDSMQQVSARLRREGYIVDFSATEDARVRCHRCGAVHDPAAVEVEQVHRFEGASDPGDESVLFALAAPECHRGIYTAAYGLDTAPADVAVVRALRLGRERVN
jgi:hypothetical protein